MDPHLEDLKGKSVFIDKIGKTPIGVTMRRNDNRDRIIIRTSIIGILTNVLLASFKAIIGITSSSIAIVMDAVNNLSDAASSIITIAGTKLAGKESDRKHPFGYGRIEYITAMVISIIVTYAGLKAVTESVEKILEPQTPEYTATGLIIIAAAVIAKIVLGRYVVKVGKDVNSDSLVNSGKDAVLDSVISASTLAAAGIYMASGISLEAWLGVIIGLIIVKAGYEMLAETMSKILGERADAELARQIKATVKDFPDVNAAYDLVIHNYGPDTYHASVHIEVPDSLFASDIDKLSRKIQSEVYRKHQVALTAIGVYSMNTKDPEAMAARDRINEIVTSVPNVLQMHGFYMNREDKEMRFDIVVSFEAKNRRDAYNEALECVRKEYPDYNLMVAMDMDYSEIN